MPCFRCGTRQSDPVRGASRWRRGVRADRQVLVCPGCQSTVDWAADLDRCVGCGSIALICRLGEVECRDCGEARSAERLVEEPEALVPDLSEEVAAALDRVLKRGS
jgi:hypothetical protein